MTIICNQPLHVKQLLKRCFFTVLFFVATCFVGFAQTSRQVQGTLSDPRGEAIVGASIKLVSPVDSVHTSSGQGGIFTFNNIKGDRFVLTVTSLGYDTLSRAFTFEPGKNALMVPVILNESSQLLAEVSVTGVTPITVKEDTLEYAVKDLRLREGALVEDALKRLDGVEVDKDGNVTAQGETVTRARINGKDFFGGDIQAAIKNLPAEIIERIQIVDDYGDMANVTGNRTGDPERILNLEIAPERNQGDFGNYRVGGGTEERYQLTGMYSTFKQGVQFSVLGNMNNTNANLFDFNIRGGGARRGPGGGSFGRGFGGGGMMGGFGGGQNGITNTGSIGLNYRQDFSEKLTMYGNYSYGHDDNITNSINLRTDYISRNDGGVQRRDSTQTNSNADNGSVGNNHRFDWNVEYRPDDKNYIKLSPTFSLRNSRTNNFNRSDNLLNNELINNLTNQQMDRSYAPNFGGSGLYNRRLNDRGRNVFVNFSLHSSTTEQDQERILNTLMATAVTPDEAESVYQQHLVNLQNRNLNGGTSLSYIEPMGKQSNLELNYDYNFANYGNFRRANAYDIDGTIIVNPEFNNERDYDYTFSTHRVGLTYRYRTDKLNYSVGAAVQPNLLNGDANIDGNQISINRKGFNFMPIARFEYRFSRNTTFNVNYSGRANEPSFTQLQPFTDYSNVNAPVTGNPDLAAAFTHELRMNYRKFDIASGNSFFAMIMGSMTEDQIVTNRSTRIDQELGLVQETEYLNTNGFYNTRGFYNFSKPFANRTYTLSFNGMANYNNIVSYADSDRNVARNWILSQGMNFRYNPKETIEVAPGVRYTYNTTRNTISEGNNNSVSTWAITFNSTINITPTWVWGADLAKTNNNGFSSSVAANPMIINTYIEKQFFRGRNGAIRFQAFDLLNEQINVSRNVTENYIIDSQSNRLARYFMLTLSYRFSNFAGGSMGSDGGPGGQGGWGGHRGPGGGRP